MALKNWSTTAGSNATVDSINWAENQAPSTVNDSSRALMADVRTWYNDYEWRDWGHTVTQTSATTFTVATDVTAIYVVDQPIRCTDSLTLYGKVTARSYSAPNTTVTVSLDSGSLSASLTAVSLGQKPTGKPIDVTGVRGAVANTGTETIAGDKTFTGNNTHSGTQTISGTVTMSGKSLWTAEGAAVASAADCNIWSGGDGNTVHVTGTTTITDWGTAPQAGAWMRVIFDGALTLTYHAITNDIEGGASITVAAGDSVEVYAVSTSAYQVRNISRNSVDEVSVASATTTDIGAVASENVLITGTTTITGLGTIAAGVIRNIRFSGALTLTHNGISLILPGSANITTAANDSGTFMSLGSGNWICKMWKANSGAPITVTEASLASSIVSQSKLKTTTGEVSAITGIELTLPGGTYGFYPQVRVDPSASTGLYIGNSISNTTYATNIYLSSTGSTVYAQQRYIQASPPYDLGDGEIPLFVFALVDTLGNIIATYTAPEAPWHYNGPTDIRAERYTEDRRGYRMMNEFLVEHGSIREAVANGMTLAQAATQFRNARMVETEVTQQIKNADMPLIPHPFMGNDLTGKTVVLLDPVSNLCESLSALHEGGESIADVLHNHLRIDNTPVPRRAPNGVLPCPARWR